MEALPLRKRFQNFLRTIRCKVLVVMALFVLIFMIVFSFFLNHALNNVRERAENSYSSMLSLYISQMKSQIENADIYLNNLVYDFDLNKLAIEEPGTDSYCMTKYRIFSGIQKNLSTLGLLDSIYIYDARDEKFLLIPDDRGHYQELGMAALKNPDETDFRWHIMEKDNRYTLVRRCRISDSVWVLAFIKERDLTAGLGETAANEGILWDTVLEDGTVMDGNQKGIFSYDTVEQAWEGIGVTFRIFIDNNSIRFTDRSIALFFPCIILIFIGFITVVMVGMKKRFLEPLDLLIQGMRNFAGGSEKVKVVPKSSIEQELDFTIQMFNEMVDQIEKNRFLIYEEKLEKQQLFIQNLQSQINPHFFSNTMNLIYNLIATKQNDTARKGLILLSSYYRYMTGINQQKTSLEKELAFIGDYLEIMKLRFPNTLHVSIKLADELKEFKIPPMLIQPLAENCIKHGFIDRRSLFTVEVRAEIEEGCAVICVTDSGLGFPKEYLGTFDKNYLLTIEKEQDSENHVGLENVFQRMLFFYEENGSMKIGKEGERSFLKLIIMKWEQYI